MATIYLSSTYADLKDYRRIVVEALRKSTYHVIAMEEYVAKDERPFETCLMDVEKADIYVGLFGFRYGYIPPAHHQNPNGLSITELEFLHAQKLKKPCLTFIGKEDAGIPLTLVDAYTGDGDKGKQVERLRRYLLTEKLASAFSSPYELATLVLAAVKKELDKTKVASPDAEQPATPSAVTWDIDKNGSPYPGLLHFTRKYAPVFFGRDAEVRDILDRMCDPKGRFILISGNSGVGKSSVVAAGVLPLIEKTPLAGSTSCLCVRMVPSKGPHPFNALMGALHPYATAVGLNPESMEKDLIQSPSRLALHVREILSKGGDHDALVLFLDQMEELFTAQDLEASKKFLAAVYEAAQDGALWVLATIRSDHLHHCHGHRDMLRVLRGPGHYSLGPIEPFMLSDLIVKPARCAGLNVTDKLARRIIHDMGSEGGHLPLLAFVLNELFKKRSNHELSETVYEQLGGINGAIAHHAAQVESTIRETLGAATFALLPKLFQSLVIVNAEGLPTRRRPLSSAFSSEMNEVIHVLVRERLLHTEGDGKSATVSISHEALFEAWPSLRAYVATNRKQLMDQTLLESRARKWQEMGKPWFSGLASGREYKDFRRAEMTDTGLTKNYLSASRRARLVFNGAIAMVIFLILGTTWLWQNGYSLDHALLKVQSLFVSIHVEPRMAPVSGGSFRQGDTQDQGGSRERPVREVTVKKFAIGRFEVTFKEYDRFAIATGRPLPGDQGWGRDRRPVIKVSWHEARDYAAWLSHETGKRFRLPTESEWEYAARSEGEDDIWAGTSDEERLKEYAVYAANSQNRTAPVGESEGREPNAIGLYDMSGNVFEWVEDCPHPNYYGAPTDGTAWLEADGRNCEGRVIRGGSWSGKPGDLRSSIRFWYDADDRDSYLGFRLAQDID